MLELSAKASGLTYFHCASLLLSFESNRAVPTPEVATKAAFISVASCVRSVYASGDFAFVFFPAAKVDWCLRFKHFELFAIRKCFCLCFFYFEFTAFHRRNVRYRPGMWSRLKRSCRFQCNQTLSYAALSYVILRVCRLQCGRMSVGVSFFVSMFILLFSVHLLFLSFTLMTKFFLSSVSHQLCLVLNRKLHKLWNDFEKKRSVRAKHRDLVKARRYKQVVIQVVLDEIELMKVFCFGTKRLKSQNGCHLFKC